MDVQTTIKILEKIDQYWVKVSLFLKKSLNIEYAMLFLLLIYLNKEISCQVFNVNTQLHAPEQDLSEQIYESRVQKTLNSSYKRDPEIPNLPIHSGTQHQNEGTK